MARTTKAEIEKIIELDATIKNLTPFITAANELVTEFCSDSGYTDARLLMIETWLAAHFYAMRDPRTTSESAGVSVSYQGSVGLNLQLTHYGQMAMVLDTAGGLAAHNKDTTNGRKKAIGVSWLGAEEVETEVVE